MKERQNDTLIMCSPAAWHRDMYREAAPSGNGLIGILVYGGIHRERIAVNHARLWEQGRRQELPDVHEALERTRAAIDAGDYWRGNWYGANALKEQGYSPRLGNPVPVGDLSLTMEGRGVFRHYRRLIHMDTGEVEVTWQEDGKTFVRSAFVSRKLDMVFCRLRMPQEADFNVRFTRHETGEDDEKKKWETNEARCFARDNLFGMQAKHEDGTWYGLLGALKTDGRIAVYGEGLSVTGAKEAVIVIKPVVFSDREPQTIFYETREEELFDYESRLTEHILLHEPLYHSAELSFEGTVDNSNEALLSMAYEDEAPAELLEKQWKFGRYLMICGTREDGLPFPLYGLWHGRYKMPWPHNMANENVQMIYWHVLQGNLCSLMRPVIHYYVQRMPQFRECARKLFGLPGIYLPAGTTPEHCYPTQIVPVILNWIGCAGWLAQMFYRYYQYTGDEETLREEILPFMLEAGLFYEHYIVRDEVGMVRIYPSVSPENTPGNLIPPDQPDMPHPCPSVENATMDIAILKELFTNLLQVSAQTGIGREKERLWKDIVDHLPAYGTTQDGDVREWQKDGLDQRYDHRHLSHIYPLFPGTEIVRGREEEAVVGAFEKAVDKRILGAQTGWSLSHMACIYARLQRPRKVAECLDIMDKACLLKNFFTLHNDWRGMGLTLGKGSSAPVQLDAAMGVVQALQESLLFVDRDCVKLLPALPKRLGKGYLRGFRFMTGTISMRWNMERGELAARLCAERDAEFALILPSWVREVRCTRIRAGEQAGEQSGTLSAGQGGMEQSETRALKGGLSLEIKAFDTILISTSGEEWRESDGD